MELYKHLQEREVLNERIKIGVVGSGQMGSGLVHSCSRIKGMEVRVISDIAVAKGIKTFKGTGVDKTDIDVSNTIHEVEDLIRRGKHVVTEDATILPELTGIDIIVEATGVTEIGSRVAWNAIMQKKPIIMLNVETDVTVGYLLNYIARKSGAMYTVASGDEPGVLKGMYDFAKTMGFDVVCLGKGKNNPINHFITPEECEEEAKSKDMNPKMLGSFIDGTKTMVEMTSVSNSTGLIPDIVGMHGPKVEIEDLKKVFIPEEDGGIFSGKGRVDYSIGKVAPGVFAIVTTDELRIRKDMKFLGMGEGPYYLLYRPFHLCDLETPISIAEAVIYNEVTTTSNFLKSEVIAIAKIDLKPGEKVGGYGSADIFGRIYTHEEAKKLGAIPMGVAPGGMAKKEIKRDTLLTKENFEPDQSTFIYKLREMQDAMEKE